MELVIGIDIGTNGARAALFDKWGRRIALAKQPYGLDYPRVGWVEQNPDDWWRALVATVKAAVREKKQEDRILAMSLSTQGGVTVLLDEAGRPLYPAVSWLDTRPAEIRDELEKEVSASDLYGLCGLSAMKGLNFAEIFWFRKKRPEIFEKAARFASTVDYLNERLTGRFVIDVSNLALNALLDLSRKDYAERLLSILHLTADQLPAVVPSGIPFGRLTQAAAEELNLASDVLVVSGAHDQYSSSVGIGAVHPGQALISAGTAWVLLVTSEGIIFDPDRIVIPGHHALEDRTGLMATVSKGGNSLEWLKDNFAAGQSLADLDMAAAEVPTGCDGLVFLPQSQTSSGRGVFMGMDSSHGIAHFSRAVMEGVALGNQGNLERVEALGQKIDSLTMIGGGATSSLWPGIVADAAGCPVFAVDQVDAACRGAGILALAGAGVYGSVREAAEQLELPGRMIEARPQHHDVYRDLLAQTEKWNAEF